MLKIYKVCSDFISMSTAQQGVQVTVTAVLLRSMPSIFFRRASCSIIFRPKFGIFMNPPSFFETVAYIPFCLGISLPIFGRKNLPPKVMNFSNIRLLRTVKRDTLRLVRSFLDAATPQGAAEVRLTPEQIAQRFVPPLLEPGGVEPGVRS